MLEKNKFLLTLFLVAMFAASAVVAQTDVYLYNENVADDVDIGAYIENGDVVVIGWEGVESKPYVLTITAPDPYPHVHVWEKDVERLGPTSDAANGIEFVNHGTHFVKNRQAVVLWTVELPSASQRFDTEFNEDITLSLWVDWDGNGMWDKDEKVVCENLNVHDLMPTGEETVRVHYMTKFRVPAVEDMLVGTVKGDNERGVISIWARGIVSYDDPDVSPDGEQLFGEVEDYRLRYMMTPRGMKEI